MVLLLQAVRNTFKAEVVLFITQKKGFLLFLIKKYALADKGLNAVMFIKQLMNIDLKSHIFSLVLRLVHKTL